MKSLYDALHVAEPGKPRPEPSGDSLESIVKLTGKSFAKAIVESRQYRESIARRVITDTLSPQIECKLWDHAYGVPKQRVEIDDKKNPYVGMPVDAIEQRIAQLLDAARRLRSASPLSARDESNQPISVH